MFMGSISWPYCQYAFNLYLFSLKSTDGYRIIQCFGHKSGLMLIHPQLLAVSIPDNWDDAEPARSTYTSDKQLTILLSVYFLTFAGSFGTNKRMT